MHPHLTITLLSDAPKPILIHDHVGNVDKRLLKDIYNAQHVQVALTLTCTQYISLIPLYKTVLEWRDEHTPRRSSGSSMHSWFT